jgi:RNA recognition motif-containing protein
MPKVTGNNRISALKRLGNPYSLNNLNRGPLIESKTSSINDARQILLNRNKTSFDARQLLTRQSSKTDDNNEKMVVITGLKDMKMKAGRLIQTPTIAGTQLEKKKQIFAVGPSTFVTIRNSNNNNSTNTSSVQLTDKISLTKTIKNASVRTDDDDYQSQTANTLSSSSNQKFVISFVNDKYEKTPTPPPSTKTSITNSSSSFIHHRDPPPVIKRSHDASIQTTPSSSSSRSPIRMSSHRRQNSSITDERNHSVERTIGDDLYEPPVKRTTSSARKSTTDKEQQVQSTVSAIGSVKRTSTGVPVSSRTTSSISIVPKPTSTIQSSISTPGIILVTNLQPSVTEDDVIELFGQVGRITEIKTLSQGCVRIVYAKREHSEQAVTKYHNRLLDGQFMYVSLQQSTPQSSKPTNNAQQPAKDTGTTASPSSTTNQPLKFNTSTSTSNKIAIDPAFFRQALFHPSNNSSNPVQFQVKL